MGRVIVEAEMRTNIEVNELKKFVLFKFKIIPKTSRGNFQVLSVTNSDILSSTNIDILPIYNKERHLIHVLTRFVSMFSLVKNDTYSKLMIHAKKFNRFLKQDIRLLNTNLQGQGHKSSRLSQNYSLIYPNAHRINPKREFVKRFTFRPHPEVYSPQKLRTNFLKGSRNLESLFDHEEYGFRKFFANGFEIPKFLSEEIKILDPVFKFVSKINRQYAIITVYLSSFMKLVFLKIYWPRNKRVLITLFHNDEMRKGDIFMEQIIRKRVGLMRSNMQLLGIDEFGHLLDENDKFELDDEFAPQNIANFEFDGNVGSRAINEFTGVTKKLEMMNAFAVKRPGLNKLGAGATRKKYRTVENFQRRVTKQVATGFLNSPMRPRPKAKNKKMKLSRMGTMVGGGVKRGGFGGSRGLDKSPSNVLSKKGSLVAGMGGSFAGLSFNRRVTAYNLMGSGVSKTNSKTSNKLAVPPKERFPSRIDLLSKRPDEIKIKAHSPTQPTQMLRKGRRNSRRLSSNISLSSNNFQQGAIEEDSSYHEETSRVRKKYMFHTGNYQDFTRSAIKFFNENLEQKEATFANLKKVSSKSLNAYISKEGSARGAGMDFSMLQYNKKVRRGLEKKLDKFHSCFYWENLLRLITIEKRSLNKQVLRINDSSSIIREEIYSKQCLIGDNVIYIEILIENEQANNSMLESFSNYKLANLQGIYMFLKIKNHTKKYEKNDKINLMNAIELLDTEYYASSPVIAKYRQANPRIKKGEILGFQDVKSVVVNLKEVRHIASLIGRRIYQGLRSLYAKGEIDLDKRIGSFFGERSIHSGKRSLEVSPPKHGSSAKKRRREGPRLSLINNFPIHNIGYRPYKAHYDHRKLEKQMSAVESSSDFDGSKTISAELFDPNSKKFEAKHTEFLQNSIRFLINPKRQEFMNFHSRICNTLKLKESDNFVILYKSIFITRPPHTCWILYQVEKDSFMVLIYNTTLQSFSRIELNMRYVMRFLPFVKKALKSHEYLNVGKRIFKCFKNALLIEYKIMKNFKDLTYKIGKKGTRGFDHQMNTTSFGNFNNLTRNHINAVIGGALEEDLSDLSELTLKNFGRSQKGGSDESRF